MGKEEIIAVIAIVFIILFAISCVLVATYFEKVAFNECTGGNATYFTAFFTELRITDCIK